MSAFSASSHGAQRASGVPEPLRRIANIRAVAALAWAVALFVAAGSHAPRATADLAVGVAALLASYPLIDVIASLSTARADRASRLVMSINAAVSTAAVVAIAATGFGSDARSTVVSFGAWGVVSGLIQLGVAIHRRRSSGGQLPLIVSGGLSAIAGISFIAQSGASHAHVTTLGGYMALGALLFVLWAFRERAQARSAD